jgi:hypothetical protein
MASNNIDIDRSSLTMGKRRLVSLFLSPKVLKALPQCCIYTFIIEIYRASTDANDAPYFRHFQKPDTSINLRPIDRRPPPPPPSFTIDSQIDLLFLRKRKNFSYNLLFFSYFLLLVALAAIHTHTHIVSPELIGPTLCCRGQDETFTWHKEEGPADS